VDDAFGVNFFGSQQWKTFGQIETHLVAEHGDGASACAVGFFCAVGEDVAEEVVVCLH